MARLLDTLDSVPMKGDMAGERPEQATLKHET